MTAIKNSPAESRSDRGARCRVNKRCVAAGDPGCVHVSNRRVRSLLVGGWWVDVHSVCDVLFDTNGRGIRRNAKVPVSIANGIRKPDADIWRCQSAVFLRRVTSSQAVGFGFVLPVVGLSKPSGKQAVGGGSFHPLDWSEPSEFGV